MNERTLSQAAEILANSKKAVALTGAGVSTESGIPDFRSSNGLWSRFDPFEYGTLGAFRRRPDKVWKMLGELLNIIDAEPNPGHKAMASLEDAGILKGIITQNIDGLHQKAGSRNVVEFHGSFATFTCLSCHSRTKLTVVLENEIPPSCPECQVLLKPDIVFFDEQIPPSALAGAQILVADADVMLVAGTSCQVVPAAMLPRLILENGGQIIEINLQPALEDIAVSVLAGGFAETMTSLTRIIREHF